MNSEKVKEVKKALEKVTEKHCTTYLRNGKNCNGCENIELNYCDKRLAILTLTLINELESENERLNKALVDNLEAYEDGFNEGALLKKRCYKTIKDCRVEELEEALLDMVVQFCQMGKEGYLHHAFMSAEENAFDVLDIEYGEKVDDVYERFNKKWERND